ncbi:MAG: helix-turn-helix transcriptional regulator [Leptolyngbya sp.]|nr:helix-turn-helix transcriptional regulator [Candidatus Melainabacteria bacterium]
MTIARKTFPLCPIERTIAVLSGRWKAAVVWKLLSGDKRYSDLIGLLPGISERVLTQALRELAEDGVIQKVDEQWHLTELGSALIPVLSDMFAWGSQHASELPLR